MARALAAADPNVNAIGLLPTLTGWTTAVDDNDNVDIIVTPGTPSDTVQVKLKRSSLEVTGKLFTRLKVAVTP